ncbi:unnamed protein product, partial [Staurois parvus]
MLQVPEDYRTIHEAQCNSRMRSGYLAVKPQAVTATLKMPAPRERRRQPVTWAVGNTLR